MNTTLKQPDAWLPLLMSLAALGLVVGHVALFGITRGGDESATARLFQLLIVAQLPLMALFVLRRLPHHLKEVLWVLAAQVGAAAAAVALVVILEMQA